MKILHITPFFSPNIGGVETHLDDLVSELAKNKICSDVLTYQPVMSLVNAPSEEKRGDFVFIKRFNIIRKLFLKLEPYPILDFLLLSPLLFLHSFIYLLKNYKKIDLLHAHGLNASLICKFLQPIFKIPYVVSTHATYDLKPSLLSKLIYFTLSSSSLIFTLSNASKKELMSIGISKNKIDVYKYWVDQNIFNIKENNNLRETLKINKDEFVVLFIGRLIEKKGVKPLLEAFDTLEKQNSKIKLVIGGTGPLEDEVQKFSDEHLNTVYIGGVKNSDISNYYNISDTLIIPSTHDEGFGRVILEALSCGKPVIGSNRGGIPEAVTKDVSILIDVSAQNIVDSIFEMQKKINSFGLKRYQNICREFAVKNYSCDNINTFIKGYEKSQKNNKS